MIELKLPLQTAILYAKNDPASPYAQTALAAHALMQAIEEAKAASVAPIGIGEDGTNAMPGPWWIERRAAAILTTLLNGTPS